MPVYLAPGVYVEEVPSAQQPIAAVGTNTVGFIGVVPDEILYPVTNEDYDPQAAVAATGGPETNKQEIDQDEKEIKAFGGQAGGSPEGRRCTQCPARRSEPEDPNLTPG